MKLRTADIRAALGAAAAGKGVRLADDGHVHVADARPGAGVALGVVVDGRSHLRVSAKVQASDTGRPRLSGVCSCARGADCAHVAALLLAAFDPDHSDLEPDVEDLAFADDATRAALPGRFRLAARLAAVAARRSDEPPRRPRGRSERDLDGAVGLDRAATAWLGRLKAALTQDDETGRSEPPSTRLVYVVRIGNDAAYYAIRGKVLTVQALVGRWMKRGGFGSPRPLVWAPGSGNATPDCCGPADEAILGLAHLAAGGYGGAGKDPRPLSPRRAGEVLDRLIATARAHWGSVDGPILRPGPARPARLGWRLEADGSQSPSLETADAGLVALPLEPPYYVDPLSGECGMMETGVQLRLLTTILAAPPLDPSAARAARQTLGDAGGAGIPPPASIRVERIEKPGRPVPHLRLHGVRIRGRGFSRGMPELTVSVATLSFAYGDHRLPVERVSAEAKAFRDGVVYRIRRDRSAEARLCDQLEDAMWMPLEDFERVDGLELGPGDYAPVEFDEIESILEFVQERVPALRQQGWVIEVDESFPLRLVEGAPAWYADLAAGTGSDWFDLELGVEIDGKRENLLPILLNALQKSGKKMMEGLNSLGDRETEILVGLEDGRLLPVPAARVRAILEILENLYHGGDLGPARRLRVSPLQATALLELDEAVGAQALVWSGDPRLRELGSRLRETGGIPPVSPPAGLQATLRPYQRDGLAWLQFLREHGLGGILADDMGLGKTVQALAHLLVEIASGRADRPSLVVAPTSVIVNWRREAERFSPELRVHLHHGPDRRDQQKASAGADLILTTYPLLWRDREEILGREFHLLFLDEAQFLKNHRSQAAQVAAGIRARQRLCLTGTPMENRLLELWSLFNVVLPGALGDEKRFRRLFATPIEKQGNTLRREQLAARVRPFLLRRTKDKVASELPPKTEVTHAVELEGAQRDLYETIRLAMHSRVAEEVQRRGFDRSRIVILDALLKLRQACCDPRLVRLPQAARVRESAKLWALLDLLDELLVEGRRVLLYSQFTSMLSLIEKEVEARKVKFVKLTGDTRDRATPVRAFQEGAVPLFLVSLKAGGTGLNLTAADTVILYDPWWNPAVEDQAADRAHRIGQEKPVFVYRLIAAGSVEERILALQARKRDLARGVLGDGDDGSAPLSAADIDALLQPLG